MTEQDKLELSSLIKTMKSVLDSVSSPIMYAWNNPNLNEKDKAKCELDFLTCDLITDQLIFVYKCLQYIETQYLE